MKPGTVAGLKVKAFHLRVLPVSLLRVHWEFCVSVT